MSYASRLGRARISARSPQAAGQCDRCGLVYTHASLRWQFQWSGPNLINTGLLVCRHCEDVPQEQLRSIVIAADPIPIQNPRPPNYIAAETNYRTTSGQDTVDPVTGIPIPGTIQRATQNNDLRVTQQTDKPPGSYNRAPGTDPLAPGNNNPGLPYDNTSVPLTGPLFPNVYQVNWVDVANWNFLGSDIYWQNSGGERTYWTATELQP